MSSENAVLQVRSLTVRFGGVKAVTDVDLDVGEGELVGLIGPNGAGKTTFVDAVTGFVSASGSVRLDGEELSGLPAHRRNHRGLARTWQAADLFDDLSVEENLAVSAGRPSVWDNVRQLAGLRPARSERIAETLGRLGVPEFLGMSVDELTQGQRKLVGVAQALVGRPRVVLLDEPAAGLDTNESEELGDHLRSLVDEGQSMLLIDHDMGLVMRICDRIVVIEFGEVIATGTPDEVRRDPRVIEAYLGSSGDAVPAMEAVDA